VEGGGGGKERTGKTVKVTDGNTFLSEVDVVALAFHSSSTDIIFKVSEGERDKGGV